VSRKIEVGHGSPARTCRVTDRAHHVPLPRPLSRLPHIAEREALVDVPNVHPYQAIFESDKAAYLVRQYLASDLYDRIRSAHHVRTGPCTRPTYAEPTLTVLLPFLSDIEKKWFTYQILVGMSELRSRKVSL
jgi:phosphoinositide-3-kinase regulatory subunit 4